MSMQPLRFLFFPLGVLLLSSCQTPPAESTVEEEPQSANEVLDIRVLSDAEVYSGSSSADNRGMIPDILYAALQALSEDRLLTPVDDNAHGRFKRVLAMDPKNELALEGLQDIVVRYLQLAGESMRRGIFDEAETLLGRARFVDSRHPGIASTAEALRLEMNSNDLFFRLDYPNYSAHSELAQNELADIARQTREHEAFFLITAPNDDLARWMVSVMREAVSGYRLRGNIELSSRLGIRLRLPTGE
ncbi:MAG: hypothetical protein COB20_15005 [SAR86 cluster bacterium]|uniref:Uncharacterized protein n=1 Tax=SAR86 cluster bacterium TaxID=2030880 RepID=A0A2A4WXU1_9GAMM|nr:MAG: hypothetical protein COB20_15005 [SAR86 cluster bacterium]